MEKLYTLYIYRYISADASKYHVSTFFKNFFITLLFYNRPLYFHYQERDPHYQFLSSNTGEQSPVTRKY